MQMKRNSKDNASSPKSAANCTKQPRGVILRYTYADDAGRTLLEEVARLACDSCEDEGVGGDHY